MISYAVMNAEGKITLPPDIIRALGLRPGDKVRFTRRQDGEIVISNASATAIPPRAQAAFAGLAEKLGITNEEDAQALIDEVRYGRRR